jgi:hypothetical protein
VPDRFADEISLCGSPARIRIARRHGREPRHDDAGRQPRRDAVRILAEALL